MNLQIIKNPATEVFLKLVSESKEQLLASPFVKSYVAKMILDRRPPKAEICLLTSYKLTSFHRRSSDLSALRSFVQSNIDVRNHPKLHAKTYIFDAHKAIVTSANLTLGGLENNYECGVLIEDESIVSSLKADFLKLFRNKDEVSPITEEILTTTEQILAKVPEEKRTKFEKSEREIFAQAKFEPEDDLYDGGIETIRKTLSGWRLDMFNIVSQIPANVFNLDQAYEYKSHLQKMHPENRNIEAKIRQQLQELRDLGLVEFLGKGIYRRLWKLSEE